MEVGVLTVPLGDQSLEDALEYLDGIGVEAVELACGGFTGDDHLKREEYLDNEAKQAELQALLDEHDMYVSALATHNNPLHPDDERAARADTELREAIELADRAGVDAVTTFSGLPAGSEAGEVPNWITAPWPTEHGDALEYQWDVATDYWSDAAEHAAEHDVKVGLEMHPNMLVYEPHSLLRLREGDQRVHRGELRPFAPLLAGHLHHRRHPSTRRGGRNPSLPRQGHEGVRGTGPPEGRPRHGAVHGRGEPVPWCFRSVGYGHGEDHWRDVVSTLRMVGYDGALSIEHEDSLTSAREGLEKGVDLLNRVVFSTQPGDAYWA